MNPEREATRISPDKMVDGISKHARYRSTKSERNLDNTQKISSFNKINCWQFPVFKVLKENELEKFNQHAIIRKYHKKEFIYLPFEDGEYIYFIKKGNIEIGFLDDDGNELTLDILGEGEIFGQSVGFGLSKGYARALDDIVLCMMNKSDFEYFLQKYPQLTYNLVKLLALKIKVIENKLQNLVFKDVKTRICRQLLRLYKKSGDEKSGRIRIPLTHQNVAKLVGSTRETASVHLAELKRDGIISYQRQRIFINSLSALLNQLN
jgi:CRP/FNR family transcriptional regulator